MFYKHNEKSDETIIIRVTKTKKDKYLRMCRMRGYTLTDLIKSLLDKENKNPSIWSRYRPVDKVTEI